MIIRAANASDAAKMAQVLNANIRIGGTTAHEVEMTSGQILDYYISGPGVLCCHVAVMDDAVFAFQVLGRHADLAVDWADIGTFVRPDVQRGGVRGALFAATLAFARSHGVATINATIRADNAKGLGFYTGRGFVDYASDPDYALAGGRVVGRISKRYDIG